MTMHIKRDSEWLLGAVEMYLVVGRALEAA